MNIRSFAAKYWIVCLVVMGAGGNAALAEEKPVIQNQQLMSPATVPSNGTVGDQIDKKEFLVNKLDLRMHEAAIGDLSLCANNGVCLVEAKEIKAWQCVADWCSGKKNSKEPAVCFQAGNKYSAEDLKQINATICPAIKMPNAATRRALMAHLPTSSEDDVAQNIAYLLAITQSAAACEGYIKSYVGPYGPQWKSGWYRALAGCRILGRQNTREQAEKDFYTWFKAEEGLNNCADIVNNELSSACGTRKAASPRPVIKQ
jgi:hypothetical protein